MTPAAYLAAGALVVGAAGGALVNGWRLGLTIAKLESEAFRMDAAARAKETEWGKRTLKLMEDSYAEAETLRAAAVRADAAARSLHDAGSRHAAAAASASGTSPAAAAAILLHSDVRRRAVETLRELGGYADEAAKSGRICVRADEVNR